MADRIETADELRKVLTAAAEAGNLDVRVGAKMVRETFNVADDVPPWEIYSAVAQALRSIENPEVVFALGGGLIVAQLHLPTDEEYGIEDEIWQVERRVSGLHGGKVWLSPAPDSASGYGIVTAFRMPRGEYEYGDWPLVEQFGVECGRFQQSATRMAT